jgi:hypothetical protein
MYICVENLFGTFAGVIHRVNGIRASVSATAPHLSNKSVNFSVPECTARRPCSRSSSLISVNSLPLVLLLASRIPHSSNVSRIAARRYAGPSWCRPGSSVAGIAPSCVLERAPPGKTCAEAKLDAFLTRWRRRIWLVGEMRRTLLGD